MIISETVQACTGMYISYCMVYGCLWMTLYGSTKLSSPVHRFDLCCYTLRGLKDLSGGFRILQIQHKKTLPVRSFRNFQKLSSLFSLFSP